MVPSISSSEMGHSMIAKDEINVRIALSAFRDKSLVILLESEFDHSIIGNQNLVILLRNQNLLILSVNQNSALFVNLIWSLYLCL